MWRNLHFGIREIFECGIWIAGLWNPECSLRSPESSTNPESKSVLEYAKFFNAVSGLLGFGILNAAQGVQNPEPEPDPEPTSRIHGVESIIQDCLGFSYMER